MDVKGASSAGVLGVSGGETGAAMGKHGARRPVAFVRVELGVVAYLRQLEFPNNMLVSQALRGGVAGMRMFKLLIAIDDVDLGYALDLRHYSPIHWNYYLHT